MALTYANLVSIVQAVTNASVPSGIGEALILNSAGQHLFNMHPWNFRSNGFVTLTLSAGASYVDLPVDFGAMTGFAMTSTDATIEFTTIQNIADMRALDQQTGGTRFYAAITQPAAASSTQALPAKRLEIYPTPSATTSMRLAYRREWVTMASGDTAHIPSYCEPLLVELVKAFALGHWSGIGGQPNFGVYENIAAVEQSPLFIAAAQADGFAHAAATPIRGGAASRSYWSDLVTGDDGVLSP